MSKKKKDPMEWIQIQEMDLPKWNGFLALIKMMHKRGEKDARRVSILCEDFAIRMMYMNNSAAWLHTEINDDVTPFRIDVDVVQFSTLANVEPNERCFFGMDHEKNQIVFRQGKSKTSIGVMEYTEIPEEKQDDHTSIDPVILGIGVQVGIKYTNKTHGLNIVQCVHIQSEDERSLSFFAADGFCLIHQNIRMQHSLRIGEHLAIHVDLVDTLLSFLKIVGRDSLSWSVQKTSIHFYTSGCLLRLPRIDAILLPQPFLSRRVDAKHRILVKKADIALALKRVKAAAAMKSVDDVANLPVLLAPIQEKNDPEPGDTYGVFPETSWLLALAVFGETFESIQYIPIQWRSLPGHVQNIAVESQLARCIQSIETESVCLFLSDHQTIPIFIEPSDFEENGGPICMTARVRAEKKYIMEDASILQRKEEDE